MTNSPYLVGVNYVESWIFNVTQGINILSIPVPGIYKKGNMVLATQLDGNAGLIRLIKTDANNSDYIFNKSLEVIPTQVRGVYARLCLKALITRVYYTAPNVSFNQWFGTIGIFSLNVYVYDNNMNFAMNTSISVYVLSSKSFFIYVTVKSNDQKIIFKILK